MDKYESTKANFNKTCVIETSITSICTYKCWYCHWVELKDKYYSFSKRYIQPDEFDKIIEFIKLQDKEFVDFHFYGGEPTLNENLPDYIEKLYNAFPKINVSLTTNAFKDIEYFDRLDNRVVISTSLHTDYVNTDEKIKIWIEKVLKISNVKDIRLMLQPNNVDMILRTKELYKDIDKIIISPIYQMGDYDFLDDIKKQYDIDMVGFRKNDYSNNPTSFKNMVCSTGFTVRENGDLYKCWSCMFKKPIMNIFNDKINKMSTFSLCTCDRCGNEREHDCYSLPYYAKMVKNNE